MRRDLRDIARLLGGEVSGGHVLAPGPGHSRLDRSMRVFIDHNAPDGFRVTSFAGDVWQDCRDHVRHLLGIEPWRPRAARCAPKNPIADRHRHEDDNQARALDIFAAAKPIADTIAESYLVKRIGRVLEWPTDLRFHSKCPRGNQKLPALVALLRHIHTDRPEAIQRIFLRNDGSDRLRDQMGKATLGPAAGSVCKLSRHDSVTTGLGITEGIENGLALVAIGWAPIWATCGTAGMSRFPHLSSIETLSIFADHDDAGQKAARVCAGLWSEHGVQVRIVTPKLPGSDWSDAIGAVA